MKGIFAEARRGVRGCANFSRLLTLYQFGDKNSIVHTLSLKEVFVGIYKKKGLGLLGA